VTSAVETYVLLRAFVDELVRCGMQAACTSPGSRSAPLVLTLAREPRLRCYSHIDERCSGFFALGLAKASGLPVAVACTSGTAAAELLPAAVEAHEARVPLLLLTADRPPELRENGAGQAIDQLKLYGGAAKWFFDVGTPEQAGAPRLRWMRTLACRAYATALEGRPGVVHLNFPLREPLVTDEELPRDSTARADGAPYVRRWRSPSRPLRYAETEKTAGAAAQQRLRELVGSAERGVVVAGREERREHGEYGEIGSVTAAFAATLGWPLLADPLSGARRGDAAIAYYDALLRAHAFRVAHEPDLILRVGDLPVSKPLRTWLASLEHTPQVAFAPEDIWQDPSAVLSDSLALDPVISLGELSRQHHAAIPPGWLNRWRDADALADAATREVIGADPMSELSFVAALGKLLPEGSTLFVASSMPVRHIESLWPVRANPPRVLCNRGANGIDGVVSTAFGVAAAQNGPVALLTGDVTLAHDLGGLIAAQRSQTKLVIVLIDNGGGAIFDRLPVARSPMAHVPADHFGTAARRSADIVADPPAEDIYTRYIATPPRLKFKHAARLYGLAHEQVASLAELSKALATALTLESSSMIELRSTRSSSINLQQQAWSAVEAALDRGSD
jgi:2-succinyl-5-enolpyruvyl-6-hydroxy-3-cyclohexene-1-carboxylate synthase